MDTSTLIILAVAGYCLVLLAIGAWASISTHTVTDFFIGGRKLPLSLTALSYGANTSMAWLLLGIGAAAFAWGLAAVWIVMALLTGYLLNWFYVAPRLRALSQTQGSVTIAQVFAADSGDRMARHVMRSAALIILCMMLLHSSAQLQLAAAELERSFEWSPTSSLLFATAVVAVYLLMGGFRAASGAGSLQAVIVLLVVLVLAVQALVTAGGPGHVWSRLAEASTADGGWVGGRTHVVALAFVLGVIGIGLGCSGQPPMISRFMAIREATLLPRARWIALAWLTCMVSAVLAIGWCGRVSAVMADGQPVLLAVAEQVLSPVWAGTVTALLLGAMLSTVDSQWLVATSALTVDLCPPTAQPSMVASRLTVLAVATLSTLLALFLGDGAFGWIMFAWHALSAAFGPLLLVRMGGKRVRAGSMLGAMWAGFLLTLIFHAMPDAPGDFLERVLPFVASLGIALTGGERRRNPDRADRGQDSVHDRIPI